MKLMHFFKKSETVTKPEPRRFIVPYGDLPEFCKLYDSYSEKRTTLAKFQLWDFIVKRFPEAKQDVWGIRNPDALTFYIVELFE